MEAKGGAIRSALWCLTRLADAGRLRVVSQQASGSLSAVDAEEVAADD